MSQGLFQVITFWGLEAVEQCSSDYVCKYSKLLSLTQVTTFGMSRCRRAYLKWLSLEDFDLSSLTQVITFGRTRSCRASLKWLRSGGLEAVELHSSDYVREDSKLSSLTQVITFGRCRSCRALLKWLRLERLEAVELNSSDYVWKVSMS